MGLSEYTGRTPAGDEHGSVIDRVSRHHRWGIDGESEGECVNCGSRLRLRERHLLVRLAESAGGTADDRRHLCDERCLEAWIGES